jgi:GTP pyrophosphokinase/guanosine-3',5'-bis(diphosphate) 3'-pyrophosphohydrolase
VFTPRGKIIKLPRGATVVDFAYSVHTDVGNACVSARIDRALVPLHTTLENGQTVEIVTAPWARPNPLWLNYVVTAKARAAIRSYLRNFKRLEAIALGRRLLEKELSGHGLSLEDLREQQITRLLRNLDLSSFDNLMEELGLGNRIPFLVVRHLVQDESAGGDDTTRERDRPPLPLIIKGTEGMVVNLAKCCRPIPGDPIIGFFNPGKGLVIHLSDCKNVTDMRMKQMNWLEVEWDKKPSGEFPAVIRLELLNQLGTLAQVASTISRMGANIENVQITNQDSQFSTDVITLCVKDRVHLANVMRELRKLSVVTRISRVRSESKRVRKDDKTAHHY